MQSQAILSRDESTLSVASNGEVSRCEPRGRGHVHRANLVGHSRWCNERRQGAKQFPIWFNRLKDWQSLVFPYKAGFVGQTFRLSTRVQT
jgi:hypothetical protein